MEKLGNLLSFILLILLMECNVNAQQFDKSIFGKWVSVKPYYNSMMELNFRDSFYTEIIRDAQNKKIISTYKAHFRMMNDSVIILKEKSTRVDIYRKLQFRNADTVRFYPYKKEFKESIPLLYLFTFKKIL